MTSPYLDQPTRPLAVALPCLLHRIEAHLADRKLRTEEERHLRKRAELIRSLLAPMAIT